MPHVARHYSAPYTANSWRDYLAEGLLEIATCWKLTPRAASPVAASIGATNHTRDLVLSGHPGVVFRASGGLLPSAIDTETGQESAGLNLTAVFDDELLTEEALAAGDWHGALLEIFWVRYTDLRLGELVHFAGLLGDVKILGQLADAAARPLTAAARLRVGRTTSARCDVKSFGDERCKFNLAPLTRSGTVTSVTGGSREVFRASALAVTYTYADGRVLWLTGDNAGRASNVKAWEAGVKEITLHQALPRPIQAGDTFTAIEGCARTPAACTERNNIVNFRGFPFITNVERVQQIIRAV
jgi:uncharacterized phage protein (TIGR02218 family)